jgi:F-type H+-transporting ATPase subunit delta
MNYSAIAVRYSKALLSLAEEKGILDPVQEDISLVQSVCETEDEFKRLLEIPVIPASKKIEIFTEIFEDKINVLTLEFLKMIATNRRENFLYHMTHAFLNLYKAKQGIKTVTFTSVEVINDTERKVISDLVKNHYKADIELIEQTNKDLIGGFVLRVDDEQFDASVANQLEKIRREFIN